MSSGFPAAATVRKGRLFPPDIDYGEAPPKGY